VRRLGPAVLALVLLGPPAGLRAAPESADANPVLVAQRSGAVGLPPRGRSPSAGALDQLERSVTRPLPRLPPPASPRPSDRVWVPDRYVPLPDGSSAHVPGHWERPLPGGDHQVPPLLTCTPDGRCATVPGGVRLPPDHRQSP
jgi:hypothetical protein